MLFKSLWRKSGSTGNSDGGGTKPGASGAFSLIKQLTYTGEYHLERLSKLLELRYKRDFPWRTDEGIREMIRFASKVQGQDIQRELLLFYLNCSPEVQEHLRSGDIVDESHYIHNSSDKDL